MTSISHYRAAWHVDAKTGTIALIFADGTEELLERLDSSTFAVVIDLLRNERPVQWNDKTRTVTTLSEMVGESEIR